MATYPQFYYWLTARIAGLVVPQSRLSFVNVMYAARCASILWAILAGVAVYVIGFELIGSSTGGLIAAMAWLCNGLFLQMTAVINAEAPLYALVAISLALCVRLIVHSRLHALEWVLLVVVVAVAGLNKSNGVMGVLTPIMLTLFVRRGVATARAQHIALALLVVACGAIHAVDRMQRGPPFVHGDPAPWNDCGPMQYLGATVSPFGKYILMNWIGEYAWFEVKHETWIYVTAYLALALPVIVALTRRRRGDVAEWNAACGAAAHAADGRAARRLTALRMGVCSFATLFVLAHVYHYFVLLPKVGYILQGRYVGFLFVAVYVAAAAGVIRMAGRSVLWRVAAGLWVVMVVWLPVDACRIIIERFYATSSFSLLVLRAGQNGPTWLKGPWLAGLLISAAVVLLWALITALRGVHEIRRDANR
jgi:hypothetical protein